MSSPDRRAPGQHPPASRRKVKARAPNMAIEPTTAAFDHIRATVEDKAAATNYQIAERARPFYEAVVLLLALNKVCPKKKSFKGANVPANAADATERNFHTFLNKLSQICDTKHGGDTVTAFVALQHPDHVQYFFASNNRKEAELGQVKTFVTEVLTMINGIDNAVTENILSAVLRKCLRFSKKRVALHVKRLKESFPPCISELERDSTPEIESLRQTLERIHELTKFFKMGEDEVSLRAEKLIISIDNLHSTSAIELIKLRKNAGRVTEKACWCDLEHHAGRLRAYLQSVRGLICTRRRWPNLFQNFTVDSVPSIKPDSSLSLVWKPSRSVTAADIIGRMAPDQETLAKYTTLAQKWQDVNLDIMIQAEVNSWVCKPHVHAEVLLLGWLLRTGDTRPGRFFLNSQYIGCSKPTCRLCEYYFAVHPSKVKVRSGHRNLYPKWCIPEMSGQSAFHPQAHKTMDTIVVKVWQDVCRTLEERVAERKNHDSNTETTPHLSELGSFRRDAGFETTQPTSLNSPSSESEVLQQPSRGNFEDEFDNNGKDGVYIIGNATDKAAEPGNEVKAVGKTDHEKGQESAAEDEDIILFSGRRPRMSS